MERDKHPLRAYREQRNLSLETLAASVGTTKQCLSRVELWQQSPSVSLLRRIHEATNGAVTPNDIILPADASSPVGAHSGSSA